MEQCQEKEPPAYMSRNDNNHLRLPSVPNHELPRSHAPSDITLPDLKTVLGDMPTKAGHPNVMLNTAARESDYAMGMPIHTRTSIESDTASNMSIDDGTQRSTSVSMDDPDVRLAAEALSGLGNPGVYNEMHSFMQSID